MDDILKFKIEQFSKIYGIPKEKHHLKFFFETGTQNGLAVQVAQYLKFEKCVSCELDDFYFEQSEALFKNDLSVKIFHGDSSNLIDEMMAHLNETDSILFWLDAHDDHFGPTLEELNKLKKYNLKNCVFLIDDLPYCFQTEESKNELIKVLQEINPSCLITILDAKTETGVLPAHIMKAEPL